MSIENPDIMYRRLIEGVVDYAIYMLDTEGNVVNWNAGAQRAKGYSAAEIVGRNFACFYTQADQDRGLPQRGLATAREQGQFESEGWRVRKDGSLFWANVVIDAIHDDQGEFLGYTKITRDITERRERDRQLVQAKVLAEHYSAEMRSLSTFLEAVIAHIPSTVLVMDALSRNILLVNRQAETLLGHSRAQMVGRTAQDCLPAPIAATVERLTDEALRVDGVKRDEEEWQTARGSRILRLDTLVFHGADPRSRYVLLIANDVTDENAAHAKVRYMAHHDTLTGMPNRRLFREQLLQALPTQGRHRKTAVLCLDLDNFKGVNDTLGHQIGDELLRMLAKRLPKALREEDTMARLGGDEFAVVLPGIEHDDDVRVVAERLIEVVRPPFVIDGHTVSVGVSIGIAVAGAEDISADHLLRYADMALYEAKRNGRNQLAYFRPEMEEAARKRRELEMDLREAIMTRQLELYYQPITDATHVTITGREALMRWTHPEKGVIMPSEFIHIAEETGLIHELGSFALHEACREATSWADHETVAVNLSPSQFTNGALVSLVASALQESGLPAHRLEVEITESVLLANSAANIAILNALKQMGVKVALDDFGTGYSSLGYLRTFEFDKIKIDKSFTQDIATNREALAIIRAINGIGRSLDIPTTAEGVETNTQLARLTEEGCSHFQGYLLGRPVAHQRRPAPGADGGTLPPQGFGNLL
ncbi:MULTISPECIES: bifunctional diguanylate cyclase/phosphodiesterase [unclassified Achromobacter]|uniref:putative bifunctional diguanylate cyclase/phosphodiesterase n=1 Tax=unclassified Achromobacter TaxID=2626865 RepID=UPI000B51C7FC|nr:MULTISPECIES: EAL domain-containing protein [unclassified Achromobacter]OWT73535.1 GGDEF domain-containing protein [Achromobacter sp. HZ34]OWT79547.1 GGDEF domain-containing protein [Achromobacter sp. HZ28]